MTREEAKEWLPIIQAWAEGKEIQHRTYPDKWVDIEKNEKLNFISPPSNYRIKPKPKYRPFKNQEECWNEMHKHPDFGWVKNRWNDSYSNIARIYMACDGIRIMTTNGFYTLTQAFEDFTFADSIPFGIKSKE